MIRAADNASTQDSWHGLPYFTRFAATSRGTAISSDLSMLRDNQTQQFHDQSQTFHKCNKFQENRY